MPSKLKIKDVDEFIGYKLVSNRNKTASNYLIKSYTWVNFMNIVKTTQKKKRKILQPKYSNAKLQITINL